VGKNFKIAEMGGSDRFSRFVGERRGVATVAKITYVWFFAGPSGSFVIELSQCADVPADKFTMTNYAERSDWLLKFD